MPASAQFVVIVIALFGFWAIVMRPARTQQRKMRDLQTSMEVGQRVVISAGIFGTIVAMDDATVDLEVAPGTVLTVARGVVIRRAEEMESTSSPESTEKTSDEVAEIRPDGTQRPLTED